MWLGLQTRIARRLQRQGSRKALARGAAPHLVAGQRGELEALSYLRERGYTVVARRWNTVKLRGDLDLVAWDGQWLCFIEVKARSSRNWADALAAIDEDKREMLRRMARAYLRGFPADLRDGVPVRFDVVSVYFLPDGVECELYRGAFGW